MSNFGNAVFDLELRTSEGVLLMNLDPQGAVRLLPVRNRRALRVVFAALGALLIGGLVGCTNESVRVALETQQRANRVQQAVFERQQDGLKVLAFRDLVRKLDTLGEPLTQRQVGALNQAWNERDLMEFWAIQNERAGALRLIGVDAKLYADQSIVDLLWKSIAAKADRAEQAIAAEIGARLPTPSSSQPARVEDAPMPTKEEQP